MNAANTGAQAATQAVVIGVDVGTGSARAAVFTLDGQMLASAKQDIQVFHAAGGIVEQSSEEIWQAVCTTVRAAVAQSGVAASQVRGIGFDATCSLVVLGDGGQALPVGPSEDPSRNIIVWMDHRAKAEAEHINATQHPVLRYVGGRISPEMETPKLLWLQTHRPEVFARAWQFFDLTDFLTWRASGDLARSTCTVTCKWTYLAHERRWDASYFETIGLGGLAQDNFQRIGQRVVEPGTALGQGLSAEAAQGLGLCEGTAVAAGLIDAHAGGLGTVGVLGAPEDSLGYVFGTSSCTMTTTREPVFVPGVWGPYYSAMVPHAWLNEGGQSAAGAAIEQLLRMHPAASAATEHARAQAQSLPEYLADLALAQQVQVSEVVQLAKGLHIVPEFLGNRAPFADPDARAVIVGLGMDNQMEDLLALYIAGLCSIGYGLRQIIDTQAEAGAHIKHIMISGGAGAHPLVRQLLADATGLPVIASQAREPVLLGSAMLAAAAAKAVTDVNAAMLGMAKASQQFMPTSGSCAHIHQQRYDAFKRLQVTARELRT